MIAIPNEILASIEEHDPLFFLTSQSKEQELILDSLLSPASQPRSVQESGRSLRRTRQHVMIMRRGETEDRVPIEAASSSLPVHNVPGSVLHH